jgi:hypothetical protein
MKHSLQVSLLLAWSMFLLTGCPPNGKTENPPIIEIESLTEDSKKIVSIEADGIGTFRSIQVRVSNISEGTVKVNLPSGLYFINPDKNSQDLITAKGIETITLKKGEEKVVEVPTYCTDVNKDCPGNIKKWNCDYNYDGKLKKAIQFYEKHEEEINAYLIKKDPAFSSEAERLQFFQIIIWLHEDGKDDEIIAMLARDSFGNNESQARSWFYSVIADARELAEIIITQDIDALKDWLKKKMLALLPSDRRIDDMADRAKDNLNSLRDRLR